ncbi:unnamed protein product (macronuclear) [Paramecium tetraurelia]|uniref:Uncharacterized protein n=1 Tax=Paramecium tetraurelia TaxID=5888 RepID=A0BQZ2_PARTE|nr:uncharacterized protein GSPATT00031188001 [Paramecium tetraurelia]CAK60959.1 unnamed protein product [Paramecium tetraurelia]|eukprot:XP_001428357.1 hypothetical protein (macronuclear) [Paramecium tetraurelia strain d4-2]
MLYKNILTSIADSPQHQQQTVRQIQMKNLRYGMIIRIQESKKQYQMINNLLPASSYNCIKLDMGIIYVYSRGFPGQKQPIQNEEVIKTAISYASSSKKLLKKYFPSRFVQFEDQIDYSQPYDIQKDEHFQTFNKFFRNKKLQTTLKVSQHKQSQNC